MFFISNLWDSVSFFIVFGGSVAIWLLFMRRHSQPDFFIKNISLFLGSFYSIVWGSRLIINGDRPFLFWMCLIPVFYGILLKLMVQLGFFIRQQMEKLRDQEQMEKQYNEQKKAYFALMLEKENETRRFRHDILNHLLCMQDQLRREHYSEAQSYLDSVLNELNTIREMQYDVGNEVVNVLLNYYLLPVKGKCSVSIEGYLGRFEHISQMDLCTIMSNLLKNATEAAGSGGSITIRMNRKEKFAQFTIRNTCKTIPYIDSTGRIGTSKPDAENHGFGLSSVKRSIQKNRGEFHYDIENQEFCVEVILPV